MTTEDLNKLSKGSFVEKLGITFIAFDGKTITGECKTAEYHLQPAGVIHGGVYLGFAETLAGAGSMLLVHEQGKTALGNVINAQHVAATGGGILTGTAELIHESAFKHIWDVKITDASGKLISLSRVSNSIKDLPVK